MASLLMSRMLKYQFLTMVFLYGDGVFEGIRAYHNSIFRLKDHVDRLYDSAKAINLEIPISKEEMSNVIVETCRQNELRDAYIRVVSIQG